MLFTMKDTLNVMQALAFLFNTSFFFSKYKEIRSVWASLGVFHISSLQETHQGVRSRTVPALQPVRHTFVVPNPSIHVTALLYKYISPAFFFLLFFFIKDKPQLCGKNRPGRSPGPVILHLHFSHLADALIQGDFQSVVMQKKKKNRTF